jgi:hypothetical protein
MCVACGCGKKKGEPGYGKGKSKTLSPKQKKIAGKAKPTDKITGDDFKAMKKMGKKK